MGKIFIVLGIGFLIGVWGLLNEKALRWNGKIQTLWLIILIFSMGVGIGNNKEVIRNLPKLGGQAFVFALLSVVGSIIFVFIFSKIFLEGSEKR